MLVVVVVFIVCSYLSATYVAENFAPVKRLTGKIVPEMTCNMSSGLQLNSTNPRPHYKTCLLELLQP